MRVPPLWLGPGGCALLACWLTTSSCAPSYRLVHQGDRYFERCYGADFDSKVAATQKEACWQAWITYYTKHQPAHRVDYALARIESLQNGETMPSLPGFTPEPSSPVAKELEQADAAASNVSSQALVTTTPDAGPVPNGCLHFCNEYESDCNARCDRTSLACSANCEHERGLCLRGCH